MLFRASTFDIRYSLAQMVQIPILALSLHWHLDIVSYFDIRYSIFPSPMQNLA